MKKLPLYNTAESLDSLLCCTALSHDSPLYYITVSQILPLYYTAANQIHDCINNNLHAVLYSSELKLANVYHMELLFEKRGQKIFRHCPFDAV
jgi:hypothetical protein